MYPMYLGRPRRQMPPQPARSRPPMPGPGRRPAPPKQNLLSNFRDQQGKLDIDKITVTAQQVGKIYSQVSPMISPMITKLIKR